MDTVVNWLDSSAYMPHGHCYLWEPGLLGLHAGSDALIALAYFSIPALLWYVVRKRGDEVYSSLALMFAAFIVLCGSTHLMAVYTIWVPAYLPDGLVKAATAAVSVMTAFVLWRMTPVLIGIPRPDALEAANRELLAEAAERRRAERERDAERVRSIRILEATSDAILAIDGEGRVRFANRSSGTLLGRSAAGLVGERAADVLILGRPDTSGGGDGIETVLAEARLGHAEPRHMVIRRLSGELRHVLASATPIEDGGEDEAMSVVVSLADITAARTAQEAIARAERIDALGRFAGGFAHDFNNLLTVISGNIEITRRRLADRPDLTRRLDPVLAAARRGAAMTRRLLMMSRQHNAAPRRVELDRFMAELEILIGSTVGEAVSLTIAPAPGLAVDVDPAELEAAILNLALNARDAMAEGGTLTIALRPVEREPGSPGPLPAGSFVEIAVTDTGTGIPEETLGRIFEPFFTTKEIGHGSGLGLSMVHGFAERCGGGVTVESAVGQGTTVRLLLPRAGAAGAATGARADRDAGPALAPMTVLVVEDQDMVREMTAGMVEEMGLVALTAADGPSALTMLARHPEIALLLTDVILPGGLDGAELAARARELRPELVVVLCSGYPADKLQRVDMAAGLPLLRKPFGLRELGEALRGAIESQGAAPD